MAEKRIMLTQDGYDKLVKKLDHLKSVRRIEVANRLKAAIALGDLSENSEYEDAKNEQAFLEGEIFDLETQIANSQIIKDKTVGDMIDIGSTVMVREVEEITGKATYGTVSKIYSFVNGEFTTVSIDSDAEGKIYGIIEEDSQDIDNEKVYKLVNVEFKEVSVDSDKAKSIECIGILAGDNLFYKIVDGGLIQVNIKTDKTVESVFYIIDDESTDNIYGKIEKIYKVYKPVEDSEEEKYRIVGTTESNPDESKISDESPLGAALMGKKAGSIAEVHAPAGIIFYEIVKIES